MALKKNSISDKLVEQEFIFSPKQDFCVKDIFECGQCFRWNLIDKNDEYSYIGVVRNSVIKVFEKENKILFKGISDENLEDLVREYFNLDYDYSTVKKNLSCIDEYVKNSIEFGSGIRILKQEIFETIISFIISANNNIPRIKKIIEALSKEYGNCIIYEGKEYYTFPKPEVLANVSVEDLRKLGMGFRDKYVYFTSKDFVKNGIDSNLSTKELRDILLEFKGVGPKVADCILLFAFNRYEVFPIDVWVRRVMNDLYIKNEDESKVSKSNILKLASEKYGNLAGLAQQYLFYWKRTGTDF